MEVLFDFDTHLFTLLLVIFLFMGSFALESLLLRYAAYLILAIDIYNNLSYNDPMTLLHCSLDLIVVSLILLVFLVIKKSDLKFILVASSMIIFTLMHPNYKSRLLPLDYNYIQQVDQDLEVLVQLKQNTPFNKWKEGYKIFDISYPLFDVADKSFLLDEYLGINISENQQMTDLASKLDSDLNVAYWEYNETINLELPQQSELESSLRAAQTNDPLSDKQWMTKRYDLGKIDQLVNGKAKSNNQVLSVIAILDTGIDAQHEDLKDNYISTSTVYDSDRKGHGTHCAGIAAAVTGNNIGIASLLPRDSKVKVSSIKVLNSLGVGSQKSIIDGIITAADKGYEVISLSLGGMSSDSKKKAYNEAVKYAQAKGAIVVVAAGNSGRDAQDYSPANAEGVIVVTAVDTLMKKAHFANDVSNIELALAAPGTEIYATFPDNDYKAFSGTSMSAPFVSGLIGLMKAYDNSLTTKQAYSILKDSATKESGLNIIEPVKALELFFRQRKVS